jgi:hypothetical protein
MVPGGKQSNVIFDRRLMKRDIFVPPLKDKL